MAGEVAVAAGAVAGNAGLQRAGSVHREFGSRFLPDPVVILAHRDIAYGCGAGRVFVQAFD